MKSYLKAAKFEEKHRNNQGARDYFQRALSELGEHVFDEGFFIQYTNFEIRQKEIESARTLYKYALENISKDKSQKLYSAFLYFEKQYGSRQDMEEIIVTKKRHQLEKEV